VAVGSSEVDIENLKGAIQLGQQTLKSLELANGGAVVAILTFYGNVLKEGGAMALDRPSLTKALVVFAGGLFSALLAAIMGYVGQVTVATSTPDASQSPQQQLRHRAVSLLISDWSLRLAVLAVLASASLFVYGTISAAAAFSGH
jgi:hypothetical protein